MFAQTFSILDQSRKLLVIKKISHTPEKIIPRIKYVVLTYARAKLSSPRAFASANLFLKP